MERNSIPSNLSEYSISLLRYLKTYGSTGQKELIDNLNFPLRKIRYAIRRLKEEQLIIAKPDLFDMRSLKYEINHSRLEDIETILSEYGETTA